MRPHHCWWGLVASEDGGSAARRWATIGAAGPMAVRVLLLTGTVGAGKTTIAAEINDLLGEHHVPNAAIDLDALAWQRPPDGPWNEALTFENLAAIWPNYRRRGVTHLVLARVLEDRAELDRYRARPRRRRHHGVPAAHTRPHLGRPTRRPNAVRPVARLAARPNGRAGVHPRQRSRRGLHRCQRRASTSCSRARRRHPSRMAPDVAT